MIRQADRNRKERAGADIHVRLHKDLFEIQKARSESVQNRLAVHFLERLLEQ